MQILVVDDEPDIRDTMKVLLQMHGHRVEVAADGKQALELAIERVPDLVFMDMKMPVMDGLTATRLMRADDKMSKVPIVCISAYLQQDDWREKAMAAESKEVTPPRRQAKPTEYARQTQNALFRGKTMPTWKAAAINRTRTPDRLE